jgi:hypothetical protein
MRASASVLRGGLSAAAAVLLLTACGGSEEPDAGAPAGGTATGSAPAEGSATTSEEDVQAFCTEAETVFTELTAAFGSVTDPANYTAVLDQSVAAFDQVQPPAEISADWSALQDGLVGLRDAVAGTDVGTPEGQAALQEAVTTFQTDVAEPQQNLEGFVTANCANAGGGAPSSTPTG